MKSSGSGPVAAPGIRRISRAKLALFPKIANEGLSANVSTSECIPDLAARGVGSKISVMNSPFLLPPFLQFQAHLVPGLGIPVPDSTFTRRLRLAGHKPDSLACGLQCVSDGFRRIQDFLRDRRTPWQTLHARILSGDRFAIPWTCPVESIFVTHRNPPYDRQFGSAAPFRKQNTNWSPMDSSAVVGCQQPRHPMDPGVAHRHLHTTPPRPPAGFRYRVHESADYPDVIVPWHRSS